MNKSVIILINPFPLRASHKSGVLFGYADMKSTNWFYNTKAWQDCRKAYAKSVGNLCERCLRQGLITPSEIVHHKVYITPSNVNDPNITLNWDNLECLCRFHHEQEHTTKKKRYKVDEWGRTIAIDIPQG